MASVCRTKFQDGGRFGPQLLSSIRWPQDSGMRGVQCKAFPAKVMQENLLMTFGDMKCACARLTRQLSAQSPRCFGRNSYAVNRRNRKTLHGPAKGKREVGSPKLRALLSRRTAQRHGSITPLSLLSYVDLSGGVFPRQCTEYLAGSTTSKVPFSTRLTITKANWLHELHLACTEWVERKVGGESKGFGAPVGI